MTSESNTSPNHSSKQSMGLSSLSMNQKYGGLIDISLSKRIRNAMYVLCTLMNNGAKSFTVVHGIVAFVRAAQLYGPSLCSTYDKIWVPGTSSYKIMNVISVFFHLFPLSIRHSIDVTFLWIYICVFAGFYIILIASAIYYRRSAKIHPWLLNGIDIFIRTLGYFFHPIAAQMAGQFITDTDAMTLVSTIAAVLVFCIYIFLFESMFNVVLIFRPDSYPSIDGRVNFFCVRNTCLVTLILSVGTQLPKLCRLICIGVSIVIYAWSILVPFRFGAFIRSTDEGIYLGICFAAVANLIICMICEVCSFSIGEGVFFGIAIGTIVFFLIGQVCSKVRRHRCLLKLDRMEEDNILLDVYVNRPEAIANLAIPGFQVNHPFCLSWQLFKMGVEKFPSKIKAWYIFAKLIHIYPEESQTLEWIASNIVSQHVKGTDAKQLLEHIRFIMSQRESQLSPSLKRKLDSAGKQVAVAKSKLRQIWDNVIQGNTKEMESTMDKAITATEKADKEFTKLLEQYPNNRFVVRAFARFAKEVKADTDLFVDTNEKVKMLNRGVLVTADHANELGLTMFSHLPQQLRNVQPITDAEMTLQSTLDNEDVDGETYENAAAMQEQVRRVKIPSVILAICLIWVYAIINIIVPIVIIVFISKFADDQNTPLTYLNALSMFRTLFFQVPILAIRYILENVQKKNCQAGMNFFPKSDLGQITVGGFQSPEGILGASLARIGLRQQQIATLPVFKTGNKQLDAVRELVFANTIEYQYFFEDEETPQTLMINLNDIIIDYSRQGSRIIEMKSDELTIDCPMIRNMITNPNGVTDSISTALTMFFDYIVSVQVEIDEITLYAQIAVIVVLSLSAIVMFYVTVNKVDRTLDLICDTLVTLPKSVVSCISESLRSIKKDGSEVHSTDQNTELSKQEETLMRTFSAASDSGGISFESHAIYLFGWLLMIGMMVGIYCVTFQLYRQEANLLVDNAPHLNNLLGAYGYTMGAYLNLIMLCVGLDDDGYPWMMPAEAPVLIDRMQTRLDNALDYWQNAGFGEDRSGRLPFVGFEQGLTNSNAKMNCGDPYAIPVSTKDKYRCMDADTQFQLLSMWMYEQVCPLEENTGLEMDSYDPMFNEIYVLGCCALYSTLFSPMFSTILPDMADRMTDAISDILTPFVIMAAMLIVGGVLASVHVLKKLKVIKFAISLLNFCPPHVVVSIPSMMDILNSNFSRKQLNTATRDTEFFSNLIADLPDAIFEVNLQGKIIKANKAAIRDFELDKDDIVGRSYRDIMHIAEDVTDYVYETKNGTKTHFQITITSLSGGQFVIARNHTQTVLHNALIAEERGVSDKLLSTILPPSLVPRVRAGETNISFAVQFATIVFIDIVEFTPWCASNTASTIMSTLNNMFSRFDTLVQSKSTMTRIKCIGDCYMAAGGIFSTVNQPNVHAKEAVEFGMRAIKVVEELDKEYDLDRRIRVGINTGGPVVAGVLGVGKPTFEILGPAIAMAQQMEHNGVPMQVHISRSVYELIYGGDFNIVERGQIEVKQGKVLTYLVS